MIDTLNLIGEIFGWIGSVISVYFFIEPVSPFYKLLRGQIQLNDAPAFLLLFSFLNCILWVSDGFLLDKIQIYITNAIGEALTLIFITIFIAYFSEKKIYLTIIYLFCLMALIGVISWSTYFIVPQEYLRWICIVFNILMIVSTGEKIYLVFKTENYNLIPIFSITGQFLSASCWVVFGVCESVLETIIPNALGVLFAIIEFVVYLYFYCQKKNDPIIIENIINDDRLI